MAAFTISNFLIDTLNFIGNTIDPDYESYPPAYGYTPELNGNYSYSNEDISTMAQALIDQGAKYVMVPNLYDTGLVPLIPFALPWGIKLASRFLLDANPNKHNKLLKTRFLLPLGLNKIISPVQITLEVVEILYSIILNINMVYLVI